MSIHPARAEELDAARSTTNAAVHRPFVRTGIIATKNHLLLPESIAANLLGTTKTALPGDSEAWEKDAETDRCSREAIKNRIREDDGVYSDRERRAFDVGLQVEKSASSGGGRPRTAALGGAKAVKTKHTLLLDASIVREGGVLYGRVRCLIRATAVDVLARYMDGDSIVDTKYERGKNTIDKRVLEVANNHRSIFYLLTRAPPPFQNRAFVGDVLWRKELDGD